MLKRTPPNRYRTKDRLSVLPEPKGQTQIEFILSILTILFVIFWMWEVIMGVYTYNVLSDAAKEGIRYAIVHGSRNSNCSGPGVCGQGTVGQVSSTDSSGTNVANVVKDYAKYSLHDTSGMTVSVSYPDPQTLPGGTQVWNEAPSTVTVKLSYKYIPYLALPIQPTFNVRAQGRIVN